MPDPSKLSHLIVVTALTGALYVAMVLGPLEALRGLANAPPMDMRPLGYQPSEVRAFLDAIGVAGRDLYLWRQIPMDMIYPGFLALTLGGWLRWMGRRGAGVALCVALCDYVENLLIVVMIWQFPNVPDAVVWGASGATMIKSGLSTVAFCWVLIAAGLSVCRSRGRQHVRLARKRASADTKRPRYG